MLLRYIIAIFIFALVPQLSFANQLMKMVENNSYNQAKAMLSSGVDPDQSDISRVTPLMRASLLNNVEMVTLLLEYNADPNNKDIANTTALHLAARQGNSNIAAILLNSGANQNLKDFSGYTALMRAISNNQSEVTKTLLGYDFNIFLTNKNKQNIFDLALESENEQIVSLLLPKLNYGNISVLESLKEKAQNNNQNNIANQISNYIQKITDLKISTEQKVTVKAEYLTQYLDLEKIANYPCLTSIYYEVANDLCVTFATEFLFQIESLKKPIGETIKNAHVITIPEVSPLIANNVAAIPQNSWDEPFFDLSQLPKITDIKSSEFFKRNSNASNPIAEDDKIYNVSYKNMKKYFSTADIRTTEWLIDIDRVPLSIIDQDKLGTDQLFNRKYIANETTKHQRSTPKDAPIVKKNITDYKNNNIISSNDSDAKEGLFIQVATYANIDNAKKMLQKAKKYGNSFFVTANIDNKKLYRLLIGPFATANAAKDLQSNKDFIKLFGNKTFLKHN